MSRFTRGAAALALCIAFPAPARAQATEDEVGSDVPRYFLEAVEIRGNTRTPRDEVRRLIPFEIGEVFVADDPRVEETRVRLLTTGYFLDVDISLRRGRQRGWVVLVVAVEERNTLVLRRLYAGHTRTTSYGGLDVGDTNLFGRGTSLSAGAVLSEDRQESYRLRFGERHFLGSPFSLSTTVFHIDGREFFGTGDVLSSDCSPFLEFRCGFSTLRYERTGAHLAVGRDLKHSLHLELGTRLEVMSARVPRAASTTRGREVVPVDFDIIPGASALVTYHIGLELDTRNAPFLPSRGLYGRLDVSASPFLPGAYDYARVQVQAEGWQTLAWGHVVSVGFFGGAVLGDAPFFEQFYLGDLTDLMPDRALDLTFNDLTAPNLLGTAIVEMRYETLASRLHAEYAVPLFRSRRHVYGLDLFLRAGILTLASQEYLRSPPAGFSGLARIPADLTFNLGARADTEIGLLSLSFANVVDFLPEGFHP